MKSRDYLVEVRLGLNEQYIIIFIILDEVFFFLLKNCNPTVKKSM